MSNRDTVQETEGLEHCVVALRPFSSLKRRVRSCKMCLSAAYHPGDCWLKADLTGKLGHKNVESIGWI